MHYLAKSLIHAVGPNPFYAGQTPKDMLQLLSEDYLLKVGWVESVEHGFPIRQGQPIPWLTYGALDYLEATISKSKKVVEFGAGFSTLFWAIRGNPVMYFESDPAWERALEIAIGSMDSKSRSECRSIFSETGHFDVTVRLELGKMREIEEQVSIADLSPEVTKFFMEKIEGADLVTIDGTMRNYFLEVCARSQFKGVLVLDNADREIYQRGISVLCDHGWKKLNFSGLGPINPYGWTTTIFELLN